MSHVCEMELEVKDLDALQEAAKAIGLELVRGQTKYKWWGHSVGDYPIPAGFTAQDLGNCDHALRIPGNPTAYEVGVVKRKDGKPGYQLLWDFYAGGYGLEKVIGPDGGLLKQSYAVMVAKKQMLRQGYRATTKKDAKGNVLLSFVE